MYRNDEAIQEISVKYAAKGISRGTLIPRDYIIAGRSRWFELFDISRQETVHVFDGAVFGAGETGVKEYLKEAVC